MTITEQDWLGRNAYRNYPFSEESDLRSVNAPDVELPSDLVVDFALTVPYTSENFESGASARVYLQTFIYSGDFISFYFAAIRDGVEKIASVVSVNIDAHRENSVYSFAGYGDDYSDAAGSIVVGSVDTLKRDFPEGTYNFSERGAEMHPGTVRPSLRGVKSLSVVNSGSVSERLHGELGLVAGENIELSYDADANAITINALDTSGFEDECECENRDAFQQPCIQTINGINAANLVLEADKGVDISTDGGNTIVFEDKGSLVCCGEPELDFLKEQLRRLSQSVSSAEQRLSSLQAVHDNLQTLINNLGLNGSE